MKTRKLYGKHTKARIRRRMLRVIKCWPRRYLFCVAHFSISENSLEKAERAGKIIEVVLGELVTEGVLEEAFNTGHAMRLWKRKGAKPC